MLFGRNPTDFLISTSNHIIDFRETAMPDSPDTKSTHSSTLSPKGTLSAVTNSTGRPLSSNSSITGLNGHHSPLSTLNGRTPSPNGPLMNPSMGQQLPPACGARQLSKLKRFLTTLQQFGSDISPEIGERVRSLVLGLVNSHLSIEEFHSKLQEATNFPLRPFVIPFLKANLPLLQRELLHCARMAKQSPQQFLTQNEHVVFDPAHSPLDPRDSSDLINENGKRISPDRPKENGLDLHLEGPTLPTKRHHSNNNNNNSHPVSPMSGNRVSPGSAFSFSAGGPIRLEDISKSREMRERVEREQMERERDRVDRERERERHYSAYSYRSNESFEHLERLDDDWRHVETMLNCILGMVDKTKRAISVLQDRSVRDREELALWSRRQNDSGLDMGSDIKKRSSSSSDAMVYTFRQTEDRVSDVRRRAEEAVNDVKRQAMLELQKAMSAADQKALDLVASERSKMERALSEVRKQTQDDMMRTLAHQEESVESCWNCGRKASETCSGCNVARYCGSFCQHKDWENHHHVCGKAHITTVAEAREQRRATLAAAAAAATAGTGAAATVSSVAYTSTSLTSSSSSSSSSSSASSLASLQPSSISSTSPALTTATSSIPGNHNNRDCLAVSTPDNSNNNNTTASSSAASISPKSPSKILISTTAACSPHHASLVSSAPSVIPSLSAKETSAVPAPSMSPNPRHSVESNPNSPSQDNDVNAVKLET